MNAALLIAAAFTFTTIFVLAALGVEAGRRQASIAPELWIPLFMKAAGVATLGGATGAVATEYATWSVQDAEIERIIRQSSVRHTERGTGRTAYDFNPGAAGGWSKLIRYDCQIVWEYIAAIAAAAGLLGGILSLSVPRATMYMRRKAPGFAVGS